VHQTRTLILQHPTEAHTLAVPYNTQPRPARGGIFVARAALANCKATGRSASCAVTAVYVEKGGAAVLLLLLLMLPLLLLARLLRLLLLTSPSRSLLALGSSSPAGRP